LERFDDFGCVLDHRSKTGIAFATSVATIIDDGQGRVHAQVMVSHEVVIRDEFAIAVKKEDGSLGRGGGIHTNMQADVMFDRDYEVFGTWGRGAFVLPGVKYPSIESSMIENGFAHESVRSRGRWEGCEQYCFDDSTGQWQANYI
jgi:hypothetical protein